MCYTIRQKVNDPKILVVTPLRPGDSVIKILNINLKRNLVAFDWVSFASEEGCAQNAQNALNEYKKTYILPDFIIKLDNDIEPERGLLDKMYKSLVGTDTALAYTYCPFSYYGSINVKFDASPFDPKRLLQHNYISSNSLIKTKALLEVGGFAVDAKFNRLQDWHLWLRLLKNGYAGTPTLNTSFTNKTNPKSVSAGSNEEYARIWRMVQSELASTIII